MHILELAGSFSSASLASCSVRPNVVRTSNQTTYQRLLKCLTSELLHHLYPTLCLQLRDLAKQYITALVMSLYRFSYFSYRVMAEKAATIICCRTEVWLVEAVGPVCWLLAGRLTQAWYRRGWWLPTHFAPNADLSFVRFQVPELFPNNKSGMTFLCYNFPSLSVSSHSVLLVGPLIFMCRLGTQVVTVILSCCVRGAGNMHQPHAFVSLLCHWLWV